MHANEHEDERPEELSNEAEHEPSSRGMAEDSQGGELAAEEVGAEEGDLSGEAEFDAAALDAIEADGPSEQAPLEPSVAESVAPFANLGRGENSAATLPILDDSGNLPADFGTLLPALDRWEEVASLVPGDPQFTPQPTDKPREDLLQIIRESGKPAVWLDRATMTPVRYTPPDTSPWNMPLPEMSQRVEPPRGTSKMRAPLVVTLDRAEHHFREAFRASGERWVQMMKAIANDRVREYQWEQWVTERAANHLY